MYQIPGEVESELDLPRCRNLGVFGGRRCIRNRKLAKQFPSLTRSNSGRSASHARPTSRSTFGDNAANQDDDLPRRVAMVGGWNVSGWLASR